MKVAIVKYNAGNIRSVYFALERLGVEAAITDDHEQLRAADRVIFPGVGEASTTMNYLKERKLDILLRELTQPVLGICLGLQLMCAHSEEGNADCIGIFDLEVKKFEMKLKVPHMGWNSLENVSGKLFSPDLEGAFVYFVHSYYAALGENTSAVTDYINPFSAAIERDNFFATQFHPEKSGPVGEKILKNFLDL
ncbi:MAG: imidazole glycerol phosphate synthase subunit HisH [Bacteroides sp. SM23_62]|nr:MAG: imidazole glycerol phosphate synthase subunit HisH [Bacteroides sp. SM23_62]